MFVEELHLEITRNCTLYCEHCLRGDKECSNMSLDTLENMFKDIKGVNTLLLTGGEPLIAINQLEKLVEIIKSKSIKIGVIRLVTNGTIMSARVLRVLKELSEIAQLDIKVSADIFHLLELERLGFMMLRNKNTEILKKYLGAVEYGAEREKDERFKCRVSQMIMARGRAKNISPERLAEINKLVAYPYVTDEERGFSRKEYETVCMMNDTIGGCICVDVNGNFVGYGHEFKTEDEEANVIRVNINNMSLKEAIIKYIEFTVFHIREQRRKLKV